MKSLTNEDIPQILNSINWQLKRIADALENQFKSSDEDIDMKDFFVNLKLDKKVK